jgi:hypothetical protein
MDVVTLITTIQANQRIQEKTEITIKGKKLCLTFAPRFDAADNCDGSLSDGIFYDVSEYTEDQLKRLLQDYRIYFNFGMSIKDAEEFGV